MKIVPDPDYKQTKENDPGEKNKMAGEGPKEIKKEENTETIDGRKDLTNEDLSFLDEDMPWPEPMAGMDISKKWNFCQDTTEGKNRSLL